MDKKEIKQAVKDRYGNIAKTNSGCCSGTTSCGCSPESFTEISKQIGYTDKDINAVPEGANLGLGCGNPVALASLKEGETVLDLGSGAGFDCFLAANKVGKNGRVIGVDMTPEMIKKARANALKGGYINVEFKQGEIEKLPVENDSVDVIISNCVINLSTEKDKVFGEAFRVLKPGGRLMVSDIVLLAPLPEYIKNNITAYVGCLAGADLKNDYLNGMRKAGFENVSIAQENAYSIEFMANEYSKSENFSPELKAKIDTIPDKDYEIDSIKVSAIKPKK